MVFSRQDFSYKALIFKAFFLEKKKIKKTQYLLFAFLSLPLSASAATELSSWVLFTQVFNFSIFFLAFALLIRKPVQLLCHQRQKDFLSFEKQVLKLEKQKREEHEKWERKLSDLQERERNIKKKAKDEGDRFYSEKQKELKELEERLKNHTEFIARLETEKLKNQQLDDWKKKLLELSKKELNLLAQDTAFQQKEKEAFIGFLTHHKKRA